MLVPSESRAPAPPFVRGLPWQVMRRMEEDIDRLFSQFMGGGLGIAPTEALQQLSPSIDISEDNSEWRIEVELPGLRPDDVDVRVQGQYLVIRAELRPPEEERAEEKGERRYFRRERRYGLFEEVLSLPSNVNEQAIRCEAREGILVVHLPKSEQAKQQGHRIPVEATTPQQGGSGAQGGSSAGPEQAAGSQQQAGNAQRQSGEAQAQNSG